MSAYRTGRKNSIFDIEVITRKEAYAPIAGKLAEFERHKGDLLAKLRKAYERGPKSEPFNGEKSWHDLVFIAKMYFWGEIAKREAMPPAERFNRLRQLARALGRAHSLAELAMRENIGGDLFRAWFAETKIPIATAVHMTVGGASVPTIIADELKKAVRGLATLELAAFTAAAANAIPPEGGRPPLLTSCYIQGLARVYRSSTGSKPGRGNGPFAIFVSNFVAAVNQPDFDFSDQSVVGAIQEAHRRHKTSMFDA